ncbi:TraI domain-containing protein [Pseudomonas sp. RC4D1]|uniref:MobH family relaxase n=1 Tax=Pseudomonas sp. RC4D1 TaxID=2834407 RepID=UPI001BCD5218|nr:MobH family relaxase [Pseudomonas sp. RC4D1]MBS7560195.1 TraI domain-containing protein [Pseudomonas sp. RC4D1]
MLGLFKRKNMALSVEPPESKISRDLPNGMRLAEPAESLLATSRRQKMLAHIWQRTSLSREQFALLYLQPLQRYAELVQHFPASESHHHAYPGGMLDHGLEIVAYALKLRQSHLLPAGVTPEDQAAQAEAWTAAIAYAALLHDLGKVAVDIHVEQEEGRVWHPWHGPLQGPYRFRYRKDREYRLHGAATGLLYRQVLDERILDWLSQYPNLWTPLLYLLAGQYEHAGVLGELVIQADQASVAQELGGDPGKALAAPRKALQRKLLEGLRYLIKEELKLNQAKASDGWLTADSLWLVSKTVSDKLRAHLLGQGVEGIPTSNTDVFNILQDHGILQATQDNKAIWKATVTHGDWSHTLTLLRLTPALFWEKDERPDPYTGTIKVVEEETTASTPAVKAIDERFAVDNQPPIDLPYGINDLPEFFAPIDYTSDAPDLDSKDLALQRYFPPDHSPASPKHNALPSGEHFINWLSQHIASHKLIINDTKALVHTVVDTAYLVSPGVFQRYAQEHPQTAHLAKQDKISDWHWVQKRFEQLQLHRKQSNGLNIWTCEVTGPRKSRRLHGYLLKDPGLLFIQLPLNNPYLTLA